MVRPVIFRHRLWVDGELQLDECVFREERAYYYEKWGNEDIQDVRHKVTIIDWK